MTQSKVRGVVDENILVQSSLGNVPGHSVIFMIGVAPDLDAGDGSIAIWDNKFDYTPFTGDTEMFLSSSNAADTMTVRVSGLDTNFDPKTVDLALTGQTQASLGIFRHVQRAYVLGTVTPAGDVYIAASDTLTAGVPNTQSKVKSKIIQGHNITHNGFYMVPRRKIGATLAFRVSTNKRLEATEITTWLYPLDGTPKNLVTYSALAQFAQFNFPAPVASLSLGSEVQNIRGEKMLVVYKAEASTVNTKVFFGADILLIEENLTELGL